MVIESTSSASISVPNPRERLSVRGCALSGYCGAGFDCFREWRETAKLNVNVISTIREALSHQASRFIGFERLVILAGFADELDGSPDGGAGGIGHFQAQFTRVALSVRENWQTERTREAFSSSWRFSGEQHHATCYKKELSLETPGLWTAAMSASNAFRNPRRLVISIRRATCDE
jgi:hypothetical protein